MSEASFPTQPAKSGSGLKTVLIVVAVVVLLGLLACGGMVALVYYTLSVGFPQMVKAKVESSQVIQDEIGTIDSISMDFQDTARHTEPGSDQPIISFAIEGPKGSGHLLVETSQTESNEIKSATLITSDGRELPIPLDDQAGANASLEEADIDAGTSADSAASDSGDDPFAGDSGAGEGSN